MLEITKQKRIEEKKLLPVAPVGPAHQGLPLLVVFPEQLRGSSACAGSTSCFALEAPPPSLSAYADDVDEPLDLFPLT